jgi:hypothetical protein
MCTRKRLQPTRFDDHHRSAVVVSEANLTRALLVRDVAAANVAPTIMSPRTLTMRADATTVVNGNQSRDSSDCTAIRIQRLFASVNVRRSI